MRNMAELQRLFCCLFCAISFLSSNNNGGPVVFANKVLEEEQDDFLEYIQSDNNTSSSIQDDDKEGYLSSRSLPTESIHSGAHLPISNYGSSDIDDVLSYARYANSGPNTIRQERSLNLKHNAEDLHEHDGKEPFEYSSAGEYNSQQVAIDIKTPEQQLKREEVTPVSQSDYNPGSDVSIEAQSEHIDTEQLTLSNQEDYPRHTGYTEADPHQLTPDKQAEFLREFRAYAKHIYDQKVGSEGDDTDVHQRKNALTVHSQSSHPEASHLLSQNPGNRGNYQSNQNTYQSFHSAKKSDSLVERQQRQPQYSPKLKPITQKFERSYVPPKENYGFNSLQGRDYYERQSTHSLRPDRHHKTDGHQMAQTDSDHIRGPQERHEKDNHFQQSAVQAPQSYWSSAANDDTLLATESKTQVRPHRHSHQYYARAAPPEENLKSPPYQVEPLHSIISKVNSDLKNVKYAEENLESQYKDSAELQSQYKDSDYDEDVESIIEQSAVAPLRLLAEAKIHLPIEGSGTKQSDRQEVYGFLLPQKGTDKKAHSKSYYSRQSESNQASSADENNVGSYGRNAKSFQYSPQWIGSNSRNQIQLHNTQLSNRQWLAGGTNSIPRPSPVLVYLTSKSPLQEFYKRVTYGYLQKGYQPEAMLTSRLKSPTAISKGRTNIRVFSFMWVTLKKESSPYRLQQIS